MEYQEAIGMIAVPEDQSLDLVRTADGRLVIEGAFPLSIVVTGHLLDLATRGRVDPSAVTVRGHVEQIKHAPSFPSMVWDSITFTCVNGTATYDFVEQEGDDFARDVWRGVRRDIVDNVMVGAD